MTSNEPSRAPDGTRDSATSDAAGQALAALLARMREAEIPPSVEEMADALWLARWLPAPEHTDTPDPMPDDTLRPALPGDSDGRGYRTRPLPMSTPGEDSGETSQAQLFVPGTGPVTAAELRQVRVPAAPALPEPLALQRGLRVLQRYRAPVRPVKGHTLDEDRTADQAAESGLVHPVLRAERRREARLLLIMDVSTSTVVWRQVLDELRQVCERAGAFREVQVQYLHATDEGLPGYAATAERTSALHTPEQLSDPTGRRLTLVLSDCAGPMWRSGRIQRLLYRWGCTAPVAVVQPLPQRMWLRTHLPARRGLLHRREGPAGRLVFTPERGPVERDALPVPVLALRRSSVEGWARLVAGSTGQSLEAAAGWVCARHAPATVPMRATAQLSGADRVQAFTRQASPDARRLACYLSAVPLFLPVMQLVQHAMLAGTGPDVLSEVLLSGLLRRREDAADPRAVRYDFLPGVAVELRKRLTADEAKLLFKHCSEYIERSFGRTARNFPALAAAFLRGAVDPSAAHRDIAEQPAPDPEEQAGLRAFAEVSSDVLRDLGRRTPWPLRRPPDPRLGVQELLSRGRDALGRYESEGLIRDLDDAVALFKQSGAVAGRPAERGSAAEELAGALLARWRVRRVGDDLREALAVVSADHVTSVRGSLLRGTLYWLLAGELRSSWIGVDDLPDHVRRWAREQAAADRRSRPVDTWAFCELLRRADGHLTRVVFGDAPPADPPAPARRRRGRPSADLPPIEAFGTPLPPPASEDPGRQQGSPAQSASGDLQDQPSRRVVPAREGLRPWISPHPPGTPPEDTDRRRLAAETLPAVRRALAEAGAELAAPDGTLRAASPEDWYLSQLLRAAQAAAVRLEYPAPERGHLLRGRILLDLAQQYLGRGLIERTTPPDAERAAEAGRGAGEDLLVALADPDALPPPERCRAWLDMASAIETFRTPADERPDERAGIMAAVEHALAAAGDDDELRLECHLLAARLYHDGSPVSPLPTTTSGPPDPDLHARRLGDLDRAIDAWQQAAALLAPNDPRRPGVLTDYAATLVRRGEQRGTFDDIDTVVHLMRTAVDWTPENDPELPIRRRTLGIVHFLRFREQEVLADLYEADWILGEAARGAEDPQLAQDCWLQRGVVVMELAARLGNPALLQRADTYLRNAVDYAQEAADGTGIARARQLIGLLLERQGDPEGALRQYRTALSQYTEATTDDYEPTLAEELDEAVTRLETEVDRA